METNPSIPSDNPLYQPTAETIASVPKKPLDKKVLILIILGIIIVLLLIISAIVSLVKKQTPITPSSKPTSVPISITPTEVPITIPTQFQPQINQIDNELRLNLDFPPPQIDETIGQ